MVTEFEAKILNIDIDSLRDKLVKLGAVQIEEKKLMRRQTFDLPFSSPIKQWVRVRDEGNRISMTLKKIVDNASIAGTQELEFAIEKFDAACEFLKLCGLAPKAYQENYRENWSYKEACLSIDTWPGLSPFLEVEGTDEVIVCTVIKELDLDFEQSLFGSVDKVYECQLGIPANIFNTINELTFENIVPILNALKANSYEK